MVENNDCIFDKDYVIELAHVSKSFKVYYDKSRTLKERVLFRKRNKSEEKQVLQDISFKVGKGEVLGLIGENGAGKSTTLKLMSKIIYPDLGKVMTKGRVSCLIELGAGFHPDMTGRENIYMNASIFGLTKQEIDDRLQAIIEFSELGAAIDNPVRTYSSGMYMRLAFSVAINVEADILLIDEILSVGDTAFQAKCFQKLRELESEGKTIVIVSHSLGQLESFCNRVIWFLNGKLKEDGRPSEVIASYNNYMLQKQLKQENPKSDASKIIEQIKDVRLDLIYENDSIGKKITCKIYFLPIANVKGAYLKLIIYRSDGIYCWVSQSPNFDVAAGRQMEITLWIESLNLNHGSYIIDLVFLDSHGMRIKFEPRASGLIVPVRNGERTDGIVAINHSWNIGECSQ